MIRALAAAGLCCVALAACGGDDDGDKAGYQRALNGFCSAMLKGAEKVQTDANELQAATSDQAQRVKGVGTVLSTFATTVERAAARLRDADVPSEYEGFNDDVVKGMAEYVDDLRRASTQAAAGDARGARSLGASLGRSLPSVPASLAKSTPACTS